MTALELYGGAILLVLLFFVLPAYFGFRREERDAAAELDAAKAAGRNEPVSIRPLVDLQKCMGSGSCVRACPEKSVLRVLDGRAQLVHAADCVGHGACATACPTGAITLVFGSERRGVELPQIDQDFQTNVPGVFIAGELGGMGLIANAIEQGIQAAQAARCVAAEPDGGVKVAIVGAGPAGIAAALECQRQGLSFALLEQGSFGGSIRHYPRAKIVMSRGWKLPGGERHRGGTISKEELIELLGGALADAGVEVRENTRVDRLEPLPEGGHRVHLVQGHVDAGSVILAVGRRGTPRRLDVPGEDLAKTAYRLLEPEAFQHTHCLVVGGGDSAVEAALALAAQEGNRVTLSYRQDSLSRPRPANRDAIAAAAAEGRVQLLLSSQVIAIGEDRVRLSTPQGEQVLANDGVWIFAGGVLPTRFLHKAGIAVETHFGERVLTGAPGVS